MTLILACYILLKRLVCVDYEKKYLKSDRDTSKIDKRLKNFLFFLSTFFLNAITTSKRNKNL